MMIPAKRLLGAYLLIGALIVGTSQPSIAQGPGCSTDSKKILDITKPDKRWRELQLRVEKTIEDIAKKQIPGKPPVACSDDYEKLIQSRAFKEAMKDRAFRDRVEKAGVRTK